MESPILEIKDAIVYGQENLFRVPLNLTLEKGLIYIIYGLNGSGKSSLAQTLSGKGVLKRGTIKIHSHPAFINCEHGKDLMGSGYYHQQRWNSIEQETVPFVSQFLPEYSSLSEVQKRLWALMNIETLLDKRVIFLSSGELRRLQIAQMFFSGARLIILDDMFIGLDVPTERQLEKIIVSLAHGEGITFVLTMPERRKIPTWADRFIHVDKEGPKVYKEPPSLCRDDREKHRLEETKAEEKRRILSLKADMADIAEGQEIVSMRNVKIEYDGHRILNIPEFTVRSGEKWAVTGNNGSGKSTLFSIICADNPQSYSCDLRLFGRERGTGESIWDIKKHIGYVSPELHRAYNRPLRSIYVVASGFDSSPVSGVNPTEQQLWQSQWWMQTLGILDLYRKPFNEISFGEQQMVLLARAFVKDPPLLVLDEPMQGLDHTNISILRDAIYNFGSRHGKSLIMITHDRSELPSNIDHNLSFPAM